MHVGICNMHVETRHLFLMLGRCWGRLVATRSSVGRYPDVVGTDTGHAGDSSPADHRAMEARLALESEAVLRRERDSLLDWKVGLELGLPELGGPAQVVRGFRGLQEVESKSASLDARVLELEQQLALARADIEREQRATAAEKEMVASFKAEEILLRDAKVLELQQELQTTKAHILKSLLLYSDFTDF